jgi:NAD(P)-dependent dehydrogenase (short-subunit alcohol dehydrogenase family)
LTLRAGMRSTHTFDASIPAASQALGDVDGFVCCAVVELLATLAETHDEDWSQVFDVNVTGTMRTCRATLRHFAPEDGTIVLVASAPALRPLAVRTAYCASQSALVMFAKTLAAEVAPRAIRVNALRPGAVETALFRTGFENLADPETARREIAQRCALCLIAEPEEMAASVLFLSSTASSYVTGAALAAEGGRSLH